MPTMLLTALTADQEHQVWQDVGEIADDDNFMDNSFS